jgi:hypothetical protein
MKTRCRTVRQQSNSFPAFHPRREGCLRYLATAIVMEEVPAE